MPGASVRGRGAGGEEETMEQARLTPRMREVVLALAECDMNTSRAAGRIYLSRGCIEYHIRRIRERTGLEPRRFYDLEKLVEMAGG